MAEYCKFCGAEIEEGTPHVHEFKKMCLNCEFCGKNAKEELVCKNEANLKDAFDKIMSAAGGATQAYVIKNLEIEPIALKRPTAKCGSWRLSDAVEAELMQMFK